MFKKILLILILITIICFGQGNVKLLPIPPSFEQLVTMGEVEGFSAIDKFGINNEITTATDPEDIWEGGGLYTFTVDSGAHYFMSSDSSQDSQFVKLYILTVDSDGDWNRETVTQQLEGQNKIQIVPASGDSCVRIYRIENESGTDSSFAGTVYVYENDNVVTGTPQTASKIRAIVDDGNNQTLMAIYTIPSGYVGFLYRGEVGLKYTGSLGAGNNFATLQYRSRRFGKVFKVKKEISLINSGTSLFQDKRSFPDVIPAKTDIKIYCVEVTETMGIWATFDIMLVEETQLKPNFLTLIGQPGY